MSNIPPEQIQAGARQAEGGRGHQTATGAAASTIASKVKSSDSLQEAPQQSSGDHSGQAVQQTEGSGLSGIGHGPRPASASGKLQIQCGPLLNYKRMSAELSETPIWHGSVLIVANPSRGHPQLSLRCIGAIDGGGPGTFSGGSRTFNGEKLYADPKKEFWRFVVDCPFQDFEARWEYSIADIAYSSTGEQVEPHSFAVPSKAQSMRILFHSCNGFSVGTDIAHYNGAALWHDVVRAHQEKPFHVMIGGGDQIYNDGVRVNGPLRAWTDIGNPRKRREYSFPESLRAECDEYYYKNYIEWYGSEPFRVANGQIPQINIWDDHDIIDGFGSYTEHFMRCPVFRGIGGVAHKYYNLFQHHIAPPKSTFTTDASQTVKAGHDGTPADAVQMKDTFVAIEKAEDPSFIIGLKPGPYVEERSRSIYCQLGARIAFAGLDARMERTRHQINYPETYDLFFNRLDAGFRANPNLKHLILLLGVPIAYPRLQWLENILNSPIIGPIRFLNKRFGLAGNFFNRFDGGVDLLDDLDDHYTARQHKHERRELVQRLQALAKQHSIRITILGGDVHLAAVGRFYTNPKHGIPAEKDWRYMPNIISSAITNKPPPAAVANMLARRNKIHHLDHDTDETLLEIFNHDPGMKNGQANGNANGTNGTNGIKKKTNDANHATMPSRNYAIIAESHSASEIMNSADGAAPHTNGGAAAGEGGQGAIAALSGDSKLNPRHALHEGERQAGTEHPAASGMRQTGLGGPYGLDVSIRVEITPSDAEGHTEGYGLSIPALDATAYAGQGKTW